MMSNPQLYNTWRKQLHQLTPDRCESRLQNMLWLIVGMFLAGERPLDQDCAQIAPAGAQAEPG